MRKLIQILRDFFFKSKNQNRPLKEDGGGAICKLSFDINKDGTIDIVCHWPEFDENNDSSITNVAYFYALAIHALNSGLLEKEILQTLQSTAGYNEYDTLFTQNVLFKLYELERSKKYQYKAQLAQEPLVSPLDVFKNPR